MTRSVLALVLLASPPAHAQGNDRSDIIRGLCQKDGCQEFAVLDKRPVADGPDGRLYKTQVRTFHASYQGRTTESDESGFVYCSATRPAVISAPAGGPPVAFFLAPEDRSPAWAQRSSTNFYTLYFALCHGLDAGRQAARDRRSVAQSLGYHVALDQPRTVTLGRVEDVLKP